ncbi:hypothetical protein LH991_09935 [Schleiferilactobacillus harbinensis]|nr:hypothetical protein LH991_09935 [Schleiferilactobacillus harbinensis]
MFLTRSIQDFGIFRHSLDRIVQKSEIIELTGDSYRVTHRQTIFDNPHRSVIGLSNGVQNP